MTNLFAPLSFARGPAMKNRLMLAPLTNQQSHADGTLSEEEIRWLAMRAEGGFGSVMTAAAHVAPEGQGFAGQLGVFDDAHLPGLSKAAAAIKAQDCVALVQLHHAGIRADTKATAREAVGPSHDEETGARALETAEVEAVIEAFIAAAVRSEQAGFDGVEIHGAHNYLLCEFLSPKYNQREDRFGGSLENRARIVRDIIAGVRARCRSDFILGLRLSVERFGIPLAESRELVRQLLAEGALDFIDLSLWDAFKQPVEEAWADKPLIEWFMDLPRGGTRLGVAGKIRTGEEAQRCLDTGADFVLIGRAAIVNHDFPKRVAADRTFAMPEGQQPPEHFAQEGLSPAFIEYIRGFGMVAA